MGVSELAINPLDPPLLGGRVGNWGTPLILRRVYDQTLGKGTPSLCTPPMSCVRSLCQETCGVLSAGILNRSVNAETPNPKS